MLGPISVDSHEPKAVFTTNVGPRHSGGPLDPTPAAALLCGCRFARLGILPAEALYTPRRIYQALFAGEKRVAYRADFHVNVALVGRTGLKVVSAGAQHPHRVISWVNLFLGHLSTNTFLQFF